MYALECLGGSVGPDAENLANDKDVVMLIKLLSFTTYSKGLPHSASVPATRRFT